MKRLRIIAHCFLICCFLPFSLMYYDYHLSPYYYDNGIFLLTPIYIVIASLVLTRFTQPSETKLYKWGLLIGLIIGIGLSILTKDIATILIFHCLLVIYYEMMDQPLLSPIIMEFHTFCFILCIWVIMNEFQSLKDTPVSGIPD